MSGSVAPDPKLPELSMPSKSGASPWPVPATPVSPGTSTHSPKPHGINSEGLRRRGFSAEEIQQIKRAYKLIYLSKLRLEDARTEIGRMLEETPALTVLHDFLAQSGRGILR